MSRPLAPKREKSTFQFWHEIGRSPGVSKAEQEITWATQGQFFSPWEMLHSADARERVWSGGGVETLNIPTPLKDKIPLGAGEGTTKYSSACFLVQVCLGVVYVCVFGVW